MYSTYIIFSDSKKKYYVGHSSDMNERLKRHNSYLVQSTKYGVPWKLIHKEIFDSREKAVRKEKQIKKRGAARYLNDIG
tara:strand:- start:125 stop:361 length:237 start_codon:yes stop_codon:yes gene_type:complete